jgi:hypothetical protein
MDDHTHRLLLSFAEESTAAIQRQPWRYYYEADGYKFWNSNLANWYQRTTGSWVRFVVAFLPEVRATLASGDVDPDHDYDLDYMRELTEAHRVTFLLSGGEDSVYMLDKAMRNGMRVHSVFSHVFGDDVDHPVNREVRHNAIPLMRGSTHPHRIFHHSLDFLEEAYRDPWYYFRNQDFGHHSPMFRQNYDQVSQQVDLGTCLFGPDKPELVDFRGKWYCVLYDGHVYDSAPLVCKGLECLNRNGKNIKSLVRECRIFKEHIIHNDLHTGGDVRFYRMGSGSEAAARIGRPRLPTDPFDKTGIGVVTWPQKERAAIQHALEQQRFTLLERYFAALKNLITVMHHGDPRGLNGGVPDKIGWFIDLDTLEVHTQEELLPTGFPDGSEITHRIC